RDRIRPPSEATGELRSYRMLIEPTQQRRALLLGHVLKADREVAVYVETLTAGLDMGAHDRVLDLAMRLFGVADRHRRAQPGAGRGAVDAIDAAGTVNRGHPAEHCLHAVGQRVVSEVLAGEHRVATDGRNLARVKHRAERRPFEITDIGVPAA